jgi:hypothetical protein
VRKLSAGLALASCTGIFGRGFREAFELQTLVGLWGHLVALFRNVGGQADYVGFTTALPLAITAATTMPTETNIVPVMVGDPDLCKQASDLLVNRHGICIQPINYPTVNRGTKRLGITPTPAHDVRLIGQLAEAVVSVWQRLHLPLGKRFSRKRLAAWGATRTDDRGGRLAHDPMLDPITMAMATEWRRARTQRPLRRSRDRVGHASVSS